MMLPPSPLHFEDGRPVALVRLRRRRVPSMSLWRACVPRRCVRATARAHIAVAQQCACVCASVYVGVRIHTHTRTRTRTFAHSALRALPAAQQCSSPVRPARAVAARPTVASLPTSAPASRSPLRRNHLPSRPSARVASGRQPDVVVVRVRRTIIRCRGGSRHLRASPWHCVDVGARRNGAARRRRPRCAGRGVRAGLARCAGVADDHARCRAAGCAVAVRRDWPGPLAAPGSCP